MKRTVEDDSDEYCVHARACVGKFIVMQATMMIFFVARRVPFET